MIGTLLIVVAIVLGIETKSLLVGEGANRRRPRQDRRGDRRRPRGREAHPHQDPLPRPGRAARRREARLRRRQAARRGRRRHRRHRGSASAQAVPTARVIYLEPDVYRAGDEPAPADRGDRHRARSTEPGRCELIDGVLHLHRAPAGLHATTSSSPSRRPAERARLRRILPLRPLPAHGRRRPAARAHRRVDDPRRARSRDVAHPARHAGLVGHATGVPAMLAIQVAQVDEMSGGRVELGLGTGWFEAEHRAYGIPFPAKRFGLLEEQLEIVTGLWSTPVGETYRLRRRALHAAAMRPALPKPRAGARADHRRRQADRAHARDRGALRDRVQHRLPSRVRDRRGVRAACARPASGSTAIRRR